MYMYLQCTILLTAKCLENEQMLQISPLNIHFTELLCKPKTVSLAFEKYL